MECKLQRDFAQGARRKKSKRSKEEYFEWSYNWVRNRRLKHFDYQKRGLSFPMNIRYRERWIYTGRRNIPHDKKATITDLIRFEI